MSLNFSASVIFVSDIGLSTKFYCELLEQVIEHDFGANIIFQSGVSLWQISDEHEIKKIAGHSKEGNRFELYFETEDIQKVVDELDKKKVELLHPIKTESWGQKCIRFFDPDHHLIEIGESTKTFVVRIYKETGTIKATAKLTGINEVDIENMVGIN